MSSDTLNFDDIQGDILVGLPKRVQQYIIFQIGNNVAGFKQGLTQLLPLITTTTQAMRNRAAIAANKKAAQEQGKTPELLRMSGVNIAFSHAGLAALKVNDNIRDDLFTNGQQDDAQALGDPGAFSGFPIRHFTPSWDAAFRNKTHGMIIVAGDSNETVAETRQRVEQCFNVGGFNATISEVITLGGHVRPGDQRGHEHFGFMDGISQPAVKGVDTSPNPGQDTISQGVILCKRDGDNTSLFRPSWAKDGSFLVLRYYRQLVPEFNTFLEKNPIREGNLTQKQGSELLGARLMGRWKSGAPVDLAPFQDDPDLAEDPTRNNNFNYTAQNDNRGANCPLAAHSRKGNPRHDLRDMPIPIPLEPHRIIRRGIPFGPELSSEETVSGMTSQERGLIFVCYQSNLSDGFAFIQKTWANQPLFPPKGLFPPVPRPGYDPIIGQVNNAESARSIEGADPLAPTGSLSLPMEWVVPRGGEYYFSPSLPALRSTFAA
ncbi:Peroxidase 2 [Trametes pubescens]|uniref:Peroxidase 2 n=1 Tax=Trametes pubescens TaxID=154538 RepID=A0A1M2VCF4_TRAPU|nr:Peroxidase 2 [Trametes pubescens]